MRKILLKLVLFHVTLIISFLVMTGLCFAEIAQNSFVGAWLFDEGVGQKALDLTGKTGNGTLLNDTKWVQGKSGNAVSFDGKNDYVEINLPEIFNTMSKNDFTITFWINVQDITGSGTIWTRVLEVRNDNTNYLQFVIQINDGEFGINVMVDGNEVTFIADTPIKAETWYYATGTWEAAKKSLKFYLNGILQTKAGTTPASPGNEKKINIGRRSDGNEETYFNGIIDEFAILNVVLAEEDIQSLMKDGLKAYAAVSYKEKSASAWGEVKKQLLSSLSF